MNEFKPTLGVEFNDKYLEAKNKLYEFAKAFENLNPSQQECLAKEFAISYGQAAIFDQLLRFFQNGGKV